MLQKANLGVDPFTCFVTGIANIFSSTYSTFYLILTGALLILGVDLVKETGRLEAAYDDAAGVTAAFNRNLLKRINRELGGDFDLDAFAHRAVFNREASRIEMHLVAQSDQTVRVGGDAFTFRQGETIHTENSYKYTLDSFRALAGRAGWHSVQAWTDADALFSVHVLRRD